MSRLKGKRKGAAFEKKVRDFLKKRGWYTYTKGVSTPGPDILALKNGVVLLLELKTFQQIKEDKVYNLAKELYNNLQTHYYILKDAGMGKVLVGVLIEDRGKRKVYYCGERVIGDGWVLDVDERWYENLTEWYHNFINALRW